MLERFRLPRHSASEYDFSVLSSFSSVPQWISDHETGLIVDANPSAFEFWRYSRDTFIGLPALSLLVEEERFESEAIRRANRWGKTGPWKCVRGDNSIFFLTVRWHQMRLANGRFSNFVFAVEAGETISTMKPLRFAVSLFNTKVVGRCRTLKHDTLELRKRAVELHHAATILVARSSTLVARNLPHRVVTNLSW
jgi:PAS domain-containing protein